MHIILNHTSMVPIYEQIMDYMKSAIISGELKPGEGLPSVRALAAELKISALTVKKAYDALEEEGLTVTVHGKGTFVCAPNLGLVREEQRRELEKDLEAVAAKAKLYGVSREELTGMLEIILEE